MQFKKMLSILMMISLISSSCPLQGMHSRDSEEAAAIESDKDLGKLFKDYCHAASTIATTLINKIEAGSILLAHSTLEQIKNTNNQLLQELSKTTSGILVLNKLVKTLSDIFKQEYSKNEKEFDNINNWQEYRSLRYKLNDYLDLAEQWIQIRTSIPLIQSNLDLQSAWKNLIDEEAQLVKRQINTIEKNLSSLDDGQKKLLNDLKRNYTALEKEFGIKKSTINKQFDCLFLLKKSWIALDDTMRNMAAFQKEEKWIRTLKLSLEVMLKNNQQTQKEIALLRTHKDLFDLKKDFLLALSMLTNKLLERVSNHTGLSPEQNQALQNVKKAMSSLSVGLTKKPLDVDTIFSLEREFNSVVQINGIVLDPLLAQFKDEFKEDEKKIQELYKKYQEASKNRSDKEEVEPTVSKLIRLKESLSKLKIKLATLKKSLVTLKAKLAL